MSLALSAVKQNGHESGCELIQQFRMLSFLQSKCINDVSKLLQLPGDFVPRVLTRISPLDSTGRLPSPDLWATAPNKNSYTATRLHVSLWESYKAAMTYAPQQQIRGTGGGNVIGGVCFERCLFVCLSVSRRRGLRENSSSDFQKSYALHT